MHESWPLKLLPTSQQTLYWTQTKPREKNNGAFFQLRYTTSSAAPPFCRVFCLKVILLLPFIFFYFDTVIAPEESFYLSLVEEGLVQFLPGIGIWQQQSILLSILKTFFYLDFVTLRVAGSSRVRFGVCLSSCRMATLPGTMPRMVRPAPGQNYPRTGFPLEGKENVTLRTVWHGGWKSTIVRQCWLKFK